MRQGFTLIELMIVIAIIAIIASIAIPNLLESRITSNEAQAAASLKSGMFPAQVQYQAGAYSDADLDGKGEFAAAPQFMAGATATTARTATGATPTASPVPAPTDMGFAPTRPLTLLDASWLNIAGQALPAAGQQLPTSANTTTSVRKNAFDYASFIANATTAGSDQLAVDAAESYFAAVAAPASTTGNEARRGFGIGGNGTVYTTKQTVALADLTLAQMCAPAGRALVVASYNTTTNAVVEALPLVFGPYVSANGAPFTK